MTRTTTRTSIFYRLFPGGYGLLVYFTVRLLQDSVSGLRFWRRPWQVTVPELSGSIIIGYLTIYLVNRMLAWFDKTGSGTGKPAAIAKEITGIIALNVLIQNSVFTPLAAFTDDGLQWGDLAAINVIPLLYSLIYYGYRRSKTWLAAYTDERIKSEKLTNDQLAAELRFLRAQYHPHFLFNALNTIYFQMDEDVPLAKKTLEQFSGLLRYQLYDSAEKVSLAREIHYLENYIALQIARSDERLQTDIDFPAGELITPVYPLLLLPLVENAFKYVGGSLGISVRMLLIENRLTFTVRNSFGEPAGVKSGGIGLENLRRRLDLLYPGKHEFISAQAGTGLWLASLSIDLS